MPASTGETTETVGASATHNMASQLRKLYKDLLYKSGYLFDCATSIELSARLISSLHGSESFHFVINPSN